MSSGSVGDWKTKLTGGSIRGDARKRPMMNESALNNGPTGGPGSEKLVVIGKIDQYEILKELGTGGFGSVYLARDTVSRVFVAVKGLPALVKNNAEEMERIQENFALVSRLHHPNIAAALVLHPANEVSYSDPTAAEKLNVKSGNTLMVMEYAPGVTLSKWRRQFPERKVPLDKAIEIVRQIAAAMDYAHQRNIIHRDIKPSNVMVEMFEDGTFTARVLDFGLAAEVRSSMNRVSKEVSSKSGTRQYMAPEQWAGKKQGAATDQYSLAVLFYELVTGDIPFASTFECDDPIVMMTAVTTQEVEIPVDLPRQVRAALKRGLDKERGSRFSSCGDFVSALKNAHVKIITVLSLCVSVLMVVLGVCIWWKSDSVIHIVQGWRWSVLDKKNRTLLKIKDLYIDEENVIVGKSSSTSVSAEINKYRKAAETGNAAAQLLLGKCYYDGKGVKQDLTEAVEWYRKAAEQGFAAAQFVLAECYYDGEGVDQDLSVAVEWYRKAAEQGFALAQLNLGVCYHDGKGVKRDLTVAVEWYRKAAEQGCATAQYNLGLCYENGEGVRPDSAAAVEWYRKAAKQGEADAQQVLRERNLTWE